MFAFQINGCLDCRTCIVNNSWNQYHSLHPLLMQVYLSSLTIAKRRPMQETNGYIPRIKVNCLLIRSRLGPYLSSKV